MSDIQVGEYVRTKNGEIGIFKGYNHNSKSPWSCKIEFKRIKTWKYCTKEYITKNSQNILDLIEVGDIVNEKKVTRTFIDPFTKKRRLEIEGIEINWQGDMISIYIENEDIKSIVTHQKYEEMEYKIDEQKNNSF